MKGQEGSGQHVLQWAQVLGGQQDKAPLGEGQKRDPLGGISRHSDSSAENGADQPL